MSDGPRLATLDEILEVRTRVLRPHFKSGEIAHFDGDLEPSTRHFAFYQDSKVQAVLSLMHRPAPECVPQEGDAIQLRGMAVLSGSQGQGVGARLLNFALTQLALQRPDLAIAWCNARMSAYDFYYRNGWMPCGEVFDVPEIGPHTVMWRAMPVLLAS